LSDPMCPFCRTKMNSDKIGEKDIKSLQEKQERFKDEMEETAFRNWLEDDVRNNGPPNGMRMMNAEQMFAAWQALLAMGGPEVVDMSNLYAPESDSQEDHDAVNMVVTVMLMNELPIADSEAAHNQVHDLFPTYTCDYLSDLYDRGCELVANM
jgi:hypothetical protein